MNAQFEHLGYFECLIDLATGKAIGTRPCLLEDGREAGSGGIRQIEIAESFTVDRGHKKLSVTIKPGSPKKFSSIVYPLCGRMLRN